MRDDRRPTASDLGIEKTTRRHREILMVPKGGWKNTRERTVSVSLPRVRFLEEAPEDDMPPSRNRRR